MKKRDTYDMMIAPYGRDKMYNKYLEEIKEEIAIYFIGVSKKHRSPISRL